MMKLCKIYSVPKPLLVCETVNIKKQVATFQNTMVGRGTE